MTSTADYKAKTPGYTPAPNRYFARQHGVVGKTTTKDWNIQKKAVTGYTAASDQYFATKQRLAYHPADKTFNGYGLKANGSAQQAPPSTTKRNKTRPAKHSKRFQSLHKTKTCAILECFKGYLIWHFPKGATQKSAQQTVVTVAIHTHTFTPFSRSALYPFSSERNRGM